MESPTLRRMLIAVLQCLVLMDIQGIKQGPVPVMEPGRLLPEIAVWFNLFAYPKYLYLLRSAVKKMLVVITGTLQMQE